MLNDYTRRAIEAFLTKTVGPAVYEVLSHRGIPTDSQIEKDLAKKYGEIADKMAGNPGEICPTCDNPELAAEIVRTTFEETRKEIDAGRTPNKEKIKRKVMKKMALRAKD